jgi:hypothetical protein
MFPETPRACRIHAPLATSSAPTSDAPMPRAIQLARTGGGDASVGGAAAAAAGGGASGRRRGRRLGIIASDTVLSRARLSADLHGAHSRSPAVAG